MNEILSFVEKDDRTANRYDELVRDSVDVLIGMDVIGLGDFSITNKDGKTTFSFREPSMEEIDYTEREE